jgi:hypothetical protein
MAPRCQYLRIPTEPTAETLALHPRMPSVDPSPAIPLTPLYTAVAPTCLVTRARARLATPSAGHPTEPDRNAMRW